MHQVVIFSQYWRPENGVAQRRWAWLSDVLIDAGYQVRVVAPPPHYERSIRWGEWLNHALRGKKSTVEIGDSGELIHRCGFIPSTTSITSKSLNQLWVGLSMIRTVFRLGRSTAIPRPSVVIGTVPAIPTAVATFIAAKIWSVPFIIDLRDAWPDLLYTSESWNVGTGRKSIRERLLSGPPLAIAKKITAFVLNRIFSQADAMLVTSEDLRSQLIGQIGFEEWQVQTIRNVFPPKSEVAMPEELELELGWAPEPRSIRVLYAGTVGRAQNLVNAVRAASIAKQFGTCVQLVIVGAGAGKKAVQQEADKLGVDVRLLGRVPAGELGAFYSWADTALVHLTDWEPLKRAVPSKTYELMTLGKHITAVISGETADLIQKKQAGHVVEPEEPERLAQLWSDLARNPEKMRVSSEGRQWVEDEFRVRGPQILCEMVSRLIQS